tara:strand:+ start:4328 stop:5089 length:762 start_codon:yes stop_codon:yes gene_type:complete
MDNLTYHQCYNIETTVDYVNQFLRYFYVGMGVLLTSFGISGIIVANMLFNNIKKEYISQFGFTDEDIEDIPFNSLYLEEYFELEERDITQHEIDKLKDKYVIVTTPQGVVYLSYENNYFIYFSDKKDIPYGYLEVVARHFVIENNCKNLLINTQKDFRDLVKKTNDDKKNNNDDDDSSESVFANLKPDDKKKSFSVDYSLNIKTPNLPVIAKTNNFKYKGKLDDLDKEKNTKKSDSLEEDFVTLDYASFKKNN